MADPADVLEAAPLGARLWVRGLGRSMSPLIHSGDAVRVERCLYSDLRRGDVAVLRRTTGGLTAQVVTQVAPLRTSSLLGFPDVGGFRVLGRVIAFRVGLVTVPLPGATRALLGGAVRAIRWTYGHELPQAALRAVRRAALSSGTAPLRGQWLGPFEVRRLVPADLERLLVFAADHLDLALPFLQQQLTTRWDAHGGAVGAIGRGGQLFGFAFLDEYRQERIGLDGFWVRSLFVSPPARGLGLGGRLIDAVVDLAQARGIGRVSVDVLARNAPSCALFLRHGFSDQGPQAGEQARRELGAAGEVTVLARELGPAGAD